ncbi:MAG: hypothetical protein CM15mP49_20480 [Actinomycetota bacterium]|nr:MAG: hypothetical protein CM15mP49_20480 [Actinomycetota bacterium]
MNRQSLTQNDPARSRRWKRMNLRTTDLPVAPAVRGRTPLVATALQSLQ